MELEDDIKFQIRDLLRQEQALDTKTGWVHLNRLWAKPVTRAKYITEIKRYIVKYITNIRGSIFICPHGVYSPYGVLPAASIISDYFEGYLVIWDELGNLATATPRLYPENLELPDDVPYIIFQGVVSEGLTLRKMYPQILKLGWKISYFLGVVQIESAKQELSEAVAFCRNGWDSDFEFLAIIRDSEI